MPIESKKDKYFTYKNSAPYFELLDKCKDIYVDKKNFPNDLQNHLLQTFNFALRETNDLHLLLAALLHDVGRITSNPGHAVESVKLLKDHISPKTIWLIEKHMHVWPYVLGQMMTLKHCKELIEHPWFLELVQLARFDHLGRISTYFPEYNKDLIIKHLNSAAEKYWQGEEPPLIDSIKDVYANIEIINKMRKEKEMM